jgi:hypothetical protein
MVEQRSNDLGSLFTLVEHEGLAIAPQVPLPRANPID